MTKYEELIEALKRNEEAFEENCKDVEEFDSVQVMNETFDKIVELLPFKDEEEKEKFLDMSATFMDYTCIFKTEVLRIGSRLKEEE